MKNHFAGHYHPTQAELSELWEQCLFILDANILLNFYRYSPNALGSFIETLERISDRLWVPHQAALEYHHNRVAVISAQIEKYEKLAKDLQKMEDELEGLIMGGYLFKDISEILADFKLTFQKLQEKLKERKGEYPNLFANDLIGERIAALLDERVGDPYSQTRLDEIFVEGKERYERQIPPGYKDAKEGARFFDGLFLQNKFGDLLVWKQIIDKAKEVKRPLILVTDDRKEDWWWEFKGRTIGPRPELIAEMRREANIAFYMYTSDSFIKYAHSFFSIRIKEEILDEIRNVADVRGSWKEEVVAALTTLGGEASLAEIYDQIENSDARELPEAWQSIVRRNLQNYSSDSVDYLGKEDLFVHLARGRWGLKNKNASQGE